MLDTTAECATISPHTWTVCPPGLLWSPESSSSCPSLKGKWVLRTKAGVHHRLSKLWYTHCRSSRLWYTSGCPGCGTLQVVQAVVHCRLSGCCSTFWPTEFLPARSDAWGFCGVGIPVGHVQFDILPVWQELSCDWLIVNQSLRFSWLMNQSGLLLAGRDGGYGSHSEVLPRGDARHLHHCGVHASWPQHPQRAGKAVWEAQPLHRICWCLSAWLWQGESLTSLPLLSSFCFTQTWLVLKTLTASVNFVLLGSDKVCNISIIFSAYLCVALTSWVQKQRLHCIGQSLFAGLWQFVFVDFFYSAWFSLNKVNPSPRCGVVAVRRMIADCQEGAKCFLLLKIWPAQIAMTLTDI